ADVVFPPKSLERILRHFHDDEGLVALTGPDLPYDGGPGLSVTYRFYNTLRFLFSRMPLPLKAFSSSTNFLVVRRDAFEESGGFRTDDVNADGRMGRYLAKRHRILFDNGAVVYISARRALNWGMARFSRHYFYVLENFVPWLSGQHWFQTLKSRSGKSHGEIHGGASSSS
ncbi:MAG TPA: glycosyltransferase family 2 protein, partial [Candidatus Bathyarchaeia archaeon]|nr:glycosyltransferase family 2 protein [Candidatus Bathyarchaeia archaeon]